MKLLTLRVADFRGLTACAVEFAPTGVTVLEGPNETGKSTLALALDFLLDKPDSTRSREVKASQPAGRDVGPEVEITAESGPYAFRYRKRFLKRSLTELEITRPAPETLTGREAHERVLALLDETMDLALWRALRIDQGTGVRQPSLEQVPSLMQALEQAAGGDADPEDDGLLDRVTGEYLTFFTEKRGQETKLLKDARTAQEEAARAVAELTREHDDLERDADRRNELERAAAILREENARAARESAEAETAQQEITGLRHAVEKLEPLAQEVRTRLKQVQREHQERLDLAQERDRALARLAEFEGDGAAVTQREKTAAETLAAAELALKENHLAVTAAEALVETRTRDNQFRIEELELDDLRKRQKNVEQAAAEREEARGALTGNPVDADLLRRLEAAAAVVATRRATLEAGAPQVEVEALDAVEIELDGETAVLPKGETEKKTVATRLDITVPGRLRVSVVAGGGVRDRKREFEDARHALGRLLAEAGVDTLEEARRRHGDRQAAEKALANADLRHRGALGSSTAEAFTARLHELTERVGAYFADRPAEPAIAGDGETAGQALREAAESLTLLRGQARELDTAREARRAEQTAARDAVRDHEHVKKDSEQTREKAEKRLTALRETKTDDALSTELLAVKKEQVEREQALYDRRAELEKRHPDQAQARMAAAAARRDTAERELRQADRELDVLGERLRLRGEDGLFDRLEQARLREAAARRTESILIRRAEAARLLYETLLEERETTRRRYRSPLRTEIETLGRVIFGPSFEVELDDDLRVTRRVVDGVALPLDSLSMGAREQLSVVTRLACARLVSAAEGVPLILDDALGYTDAKRLEAMARVLETAAATSQVIVLTCFGDRYRKIAGARMVSLTP